MLKDSISKLQLIKSLVKGSSISDIDALDSLNTVLGNYSRIQQNITEEDKELNIYSREIKKLIEINKKAKDVEESLKNLKFENQKIYDELIIHFNRK